MRGSIRQRGTTYTCYWFTTDPATGKRRQHSRGGFRTKGLAQRHLNATVGKVDEGSWRPDRPLTVKELLEEHWLPAQRSRELRASTVDGYRRVAETWIIPYLGGVRVSALTPQTVVKWTETLRTVKSANGRPGLSGRSAQYAVGTLKSACAFAVATGILGRNPIVGVRRPRGTAPEMRCWDETQARTFLDATRDDRLAWCWALLLTRGLRRGELAGLRWPAVDLDGGTLRITETRITVGGEAVTSLPKTAAGRRPIPLDPLLVALLRTHRKRQLEERLRAGGAYSDDGYLLADEIGTPYHPDTVAGWFESKIHELELPRITVHGGRHTAATLMLKGGVPVKVVAEILGHADPGVTLRTYQHVLPGVSAEAGAALSARLLGAATQ